MHPDLQSPPSPAPPKVFPLFSGRCLVRSLGEGALAGLVAGSALAIWEIWLGRDLTHGMSWLALERLAGSAMKWMLACALGSLLLEILLRALGRAGRTVTHFAVAALGMGVLVSLGISAFPLRNELFPLHRFTGKPMSILFFCVMALAVGALLAVRCADALRRVASTREGAIRGNKRENALPPATPDVSPSGEPRCNLPGWRRALAGAGWAAALLVTLIALGLPFAAGMRAAGKPSILLISIDTLRADRVGAFGAIRPLTPHLDRFAREGIVFDQAVSAAPWTLPSHASLFTSVLPFDHRVRWDSRRLAPKFPTLVERLRDSGYRTAAFTGGGYVSSEFGFAQGFEIYRDLDEGKGGGPRVVLEPALAWARDHRDEPFFLFVHTYEPHSPFDHPRFANPEDQGRLDGRLKVQEVDDIHRGRLVLTPNERRYAADLYDGDVAYTDEMVGGFLEELEADGILDQLLLVLLSDHGEELWEHHPDFSPAHGHSLYEEVLRVPLFVRAPGRVPAGKRVRTPVSLLDVAPTLLEIAGLREEPAHQGRSLARTLETGQDPEAVPVWAESVQFGPDRFALREGSMKVVLTPQPLGTHNDISLTARPLEVYDLLLDPGERRDLSRDMNDHVDQLVQILWPRVDRVFKPLGTDGERHPLPDELTRQLKSLGYLQ